MNGNILEWGGGCNKKKRKINAPLQKLIFLKGADTLLRDQTFIHEPVLCVARTTDRMQNFLKHIRVISHNGKRYDNIFVLKHIIEEMNITLNVIMNGNQLLHVTIPETNVSFIDSLSYFPMPLSALPKAFGLPNELEKSYFPHFFNTKETNTISGHIRYKILCL
ncbi:hypothetical protein B566_EDAN014209 [Ephemera danica]|nr:hypothetical protein B566_EDAN014209 [Ephemera danica]